MTDAGNGARSAISARRPEAGMFEDGVALFGCSLPPRCPGAQAVQAGNDNEPPWLGDPEELGNGTSGIFDELDGGYRHGFVEGTVGERQPAHIALDHMEGATRRLFPSPPQHGKRKLEPDNARADGEEIKGEDAGAASHIQDPFSWGRPSHFEKKSALIFPDQPADGTLEPLIVLLRPLIEDLCHR